MNESVHQVYKGYNGNLILTNDGIVIQRGVKGVFGGGGMIRGNKTIPYSSIVAVQFKKAGLFNGYIQFSIKGGSEAKNGLKEANKDENTITFVRPSKNSEFQTAKETIEKRTLQNGNHKYSDLDELEKLSTLHDKGIITQEEFDKKKSQLLS